MSLGLLGNTLYQLFLAVSILSMTIEPFAVDAGPKFSRLVVCSPLFGSAGIEAGRPGVYYSGDES